MSGYGKNTAPIASQITPARRSYIDRRSERLNWSRAEVVTQIVAYWFAMGAPALSELDALAPVIPVPKDCQEPLKAYWVRSCGEASVEATKILEQHREGPAKGSGPGSSPTAHTGTRNVR